MCGRFSQAMTREDYLALLAEEAERDIPYDPEPIRRFNVAPGTKVLQLSERDEQLHLDPVLWGDISGGDKPPLINTRVETAATSGMFKPLWQHGRAICFTDSWYEWKKEGDKKQPYFIHRADGQPIFMAAIGRSGNLIVYRGESIFRFIAHCCGIPCPAKHIVPYPSFALRWSSTPISFALPAHGALSSKS